MLLISSNKTKAQQGFSLFPDSNVVWLMEQYSGGPGTNWNYTDSVGGDTIINTYTYHKIYNDYFTFTSHYAGAYRSDTNGRTYYVPFDSINDYLIRDYSASLGDTIKDVYIGGSIVMPGYALIDLYVDSVSSVTVGPYHLKKMVLSNQAAFDTLGLIGGYGHTIRWIEKIGCIDGGFYNNTYEGVLWGSLPKLFCMHYNDTIYATSIATQFATPTYVYGKCINPSGINENQKEEINVIVKPNPFTDNINIENKNAYDVEYIIYNSLGQKITMPAKINSYSTQSINMEGLHSGIYYIQIRSENTKQTSLKIIKY